ncbi:MAG: hypothetical protein H6767_09390 [Candidatus Peribacteria bacterium]|nr:MAG: hypothetical protein H6767_09390 [Candidatus Peribacteria bacterium]
MSYRRNRGIQKTLKDYIVPIIGGVIVLLLLVNVFSGDDTASVDGGVSTEENTTALNVSLYGDSTEAYVEYTGGNRKLIESDISLFKGEKVVVKEGNVTI